MIAPHNRIMIIVWLPIVLVLLGHVIIWSAS
mgnify:CR=1 FL=1